MSDAVFPSPLKRRDYFLLAAFCILLYGYTVLCGRVLTGHESVQPENAREMMADHDWLVPKCGGLPWLERPPLPHWIIGGIDALFGQYDNDRVVRIGPLLMGTSIVLITAWLAALWFGRAHGIVSGLILATMLEFFYYASDPEADIFLCAIVTGAMALFAHLEFRRNSPTDRQATGFLGARPWALLAFFIVFGATNLAKGLIFGSLMVAIPVTGYLASNADFRALRRYVWLWGWLAFVIVAGAWPLAVYLRYPDVLELWKSDYVGRLNRGYVAEPPWYYLTLLPYVMLPWTPVALLGLGLTAAAAAKRRQSPERFLWCWAVLPPLLFSIPDGKHHHYLLQCLAPWAVLGGLGAVRWWQSIPQWPALIRNPGLGLLLLGVPGDLALAALGHRLPGPTWLLPALLIAWPAFVLALCWLVTQRNSRIAVGGVFALVAAGYCFMTTFQASFLNSYRNDMAFLEKVKTVVGPDRTLYVNFDADRPLETFQLLFYGHPRQALLRNLSFLRDQRIQEQTVYVLARAKDADKLPQYGDVTVVLQSEKTRGETSLGERRTLFRLQFRQDLERKRADVYISPMQVTSRKDGPFLD